MEDVTQKQIYERLVAVETKVDKIDAQTAEVIVAFQSAKGAFIALDWLSRFAGKILKIGAFITAFGVATTIVWERWTK
jgi:hypothetical protein